jgi:glycosyltransferase involved in cell wall biosynthesis
MLSSRTVGCRYSFYLHRVGSTTLKSVAVFAPNGGQNLSGGGAAYTTLVMANALAEQDLKVYLLAANGSPARELGSSFGIGLRPEVVPVFLNESKGGRVAFPPYLSLRLLSQSLARLVERVRLGCVVFGDDPPRGAVSLLRNAGVAAVSYCHFSYRVRSVVPSAAFASENATLSLPAYMAYWRAALDPPEDLDLVVCNSSVTRAVTSAAFPVAKTTVVHPPCPDPAPMSGRRPPLVIHSAQLSRTFESVYLQSAIARLSPRGVRFAFLRAEGVPRALRRRVLRSGAKLYRTLDRESYHRLLGTSRFCLSNKRFEPFGISTVEGMSGGAVPLVLRSALNGSFVDIIEKGKYGIVFSNGAELAEAVEALVDDEPLWSRMSALAIERSRDFSVAKFKSRFRAVLSPYLG